MNEVQVVMITNPCNFAEVKTKVRKYFKDAEMVNVERTIEFNNGEYDRFSAGFIDDCLLLAGKGGFKDDVRQVVKITPPNRTDLYVDPSGLNYARYVGLAIVKVDC